MPRLLLLMLFACSAAAASEDYYDFARVINAEPITAEKKVPVDKVLCEPAEEVAPPGDARRTRPDASLGDLIRADDRRRRPDCRRVTRYETRVETVGWRVTYDYDGQTYVRPMKNKPGARIRVRVELDPR